MPPCVSLSFADEYGAYWVCGWAHTVSASITKRIVSRPCRLITFLPTEILQAYHAPGVGSTRLGSLFLTLPMFTLRRASTKNIL